MLQTEFDQIAYKKTVFEDGEASGIKKGEKKKAKEIAFNLLRFGSKAEDVAKATGLSMKDVAKLQRNINA